MTVWLINAYGPIPGEGWRDYRYTIIGRTLAKAGFDVVWWTSNFSHHFKAFRAHDWEDRNIEPGFRVRLVPSPGYRNSISLRRVWNELHFAWRVYLRAKREARPDWIIATDPPQAVGRMAYWLACYWKCPLILDVMDLWPEQFALALPKRLRGLAPLAFSPLMALRKKNHTRADGLITLCRTDFEKIARQVPASRIVPSAIIFNGIDVPAFRSAAEEPLTEVPLPGKPKNQIWAVYAGTLGDSYDISTLMHAAVLLHDRKINIRILIAGLGPLLPALRAFIRDRQLDNLIYLGRLRPAQLAGLYRLCDIGICAYGPDSLVSMPDKLYDYLASGLPIVSSLPGELFALLTDRCLGLPYAAGNPESLAIALEKLAVDAAERKAMGQRSFEVGNAFDRSIQYGILPGFLERTRHWYESKHSLQEA